MPALILVVFLLIVLACVGLGLCLKLTFGLIFDPYVPYSDALWAVAFGVLGFFCVRVALLLIAGAYPHG